MEHPPLSSEIIADFEQMPSQLQVAARYVLDHPEDVALLSMREQARSAGVQPATMTRFAKRLGLDGYEALRARYAEAMRGGSINFAGRAQKQLASQKLKGDRSLASDMLGSIGKALDALATPSALDDLVAVAEILGAAERIYCIGLRSSYSVAWHFHYILSLRGQTSTLLDAVAGTGLDPVRHATARDALFVVSVAPYTRATVEIADYAGQRSVPVVALTDSRVAPLAKLARRSLIVSTHSPSFIDTMGPAFVMAEILATLMVGRGGQPALEALREADAQIAAFNVHIGQRQRGGSP